MESKFKPPAPPPKKSMVSELLETIRAFIANEEPIDKAQRNSAMSELLKDQLRLGYKTEMVRLSLEWTMGVPRVIVMGTEQKVDARYVDMRTDRGGKTTVMIEFDVDDEEMNVPVTAKGE